MGLVLRLSLVISTLKASSHPKEKPHNRSQPGVDPCRSSFPRWPFRATLGVSLDPQTVCGLGPLAKADGLRGPSGPGETLADNVQHSHSDSSSF